MAIPVNKLRPAMAHAEGKAVAMAAPAADAAPPVAAARASKGSLHDLLESASVRASASRSSRRARAGASAVAAAPRERWAADEAPPPPPKPRLDPNARYATTYRPGGAALAAFDAALARGAIPAAYRDLVGDFAARHAPAIPAPKRGGLAIAVDTERAAIAPGGGPLHLRIALRSSVAKPPRAVLSVHLVLDVSGSMNGAPIDSARRAAAALVQRLEPQDGFSLVTFSDRARVVVPAGSIGSRRQQVLARIRGVRTEGGTNVSAGLDLGYGQALSRAMPAEAVRIVMLISDGRANAGEVDLDALAARSAHAFQSSVQTSAFGVGDDFDPRLLSTLADRGAGGYYYLADATQIAPALARELDARLRPVAQAVEVRVRLRPEVSATKVYGSHALAGSEEAAVRAQEVSVDAQSARRDRIARDRQHDAPGGMRFFMPSFARDDHHAMLLLLDVPGGVSRVRIGSVEIRYKDRLLGRNVTSEIPIRLEHARSDTASAATTNTSVLRTVQAFAAGDAILAAAERVEGGDRPAAARILGERADLLARAARGLGDPLFKEDGARLTRLASAVSGEGDPLAVAILLRGSGSGYLR